jgi:hypothetical protein
MRRLSETSGGDSRGGRFDGDEVHDRDQDDDADNEPKRS